jgi:hypothetical protein
MQADGIIAAAFLASRSYRAYHVSLPAFVDDGKGS